MAGQLSYFANSAPEKTPFAIERYRAECLRLLDVLERGLDGREYVAGDYSIADMALYSWIEPMHERLGSTAPRVNIPRWLATMASRPAVELVMTQVEGSALHVARDIAPAS